MLPRSRALYRPSDSEHSTGAQGRRESHTGIRGPTDAGITQPHELTFLDSGSKNLPPPGTVVVGWFEGSEDTSTRPLISSGSQCGTAVALDQGRVREQGDLEAVLANYHASYAHDVPVDRLTLD